MTRDDLEHLPLSDVLRALERGRVGHRAVMDYLRIDSLVRLVDTMHDNGFQMPGHRPMPIPQSTLALLRLIVRKQAPERQEAERVATTQSSGNRHLGSHVKNRQK